MLLKHSTAVKTGGEGKGGKQCGSLFLFTPLVVSELQCLMGICSGVAVLLHIKKPPCGMYDGELLVLRRSWQVLVNAELWILLQSLESLRPFYK